MDAPKPLEWHPYYRGMTWLLDWVERRGPYGHLYDIRIPRPGPRVTFTMQPDELYPTAAATDPIVMTRRTVAALAPYVGRPFHYEWYVGEDHLRRYIAGESRIVYEDGRP